MNGNLAQRSHWIFDLDNTLADSAIDFADLRRALGLPPGRPILEEIGRRPEVEAGILRARLDTLEAAYAERASPLPGARVLLEELRETGAGLAILTRNSRRNAWITLETCGLAEFFLEESVLGRDEAAPKPDPDGIHQLLRRWAVGAERAVMVGDYRFDLEAGRRAGVTTVYYDRHDEGSWTDQADFRVCSHDELRAIRTGL